MDVKVPVAFLIALVLALSTKQGKHLDIRRIGSKTLMSSYILCKLGFFKENFTETIIFLRSGQNLNLSTK